MRHLVGNSLAMVGWGTPSQEKAKDGLAAALRLSIEHLHYAQPALDTGWSQTVSVHSIVQRPEAVHEVRLVVRWRAFLDVVAQHGCHSFCNHRVSHTLKFF